MVLTTVLRDSEVRRVRPVPEFDRVEHQRFRLVLPFPDLPMGLEPFQVACDVPLPDRFYEVPVAADLKPALESVAPMASIDCGWLETGHC